MAVTKSPPKSELSFSCPVIGPKDYVVKGPSGWPEAFRRKKLDGQLDDFVKSIAPMLDVAELVDLFIATRELIEKPEPTTWFTVIGFLGRHLQIHPHAIAPECGIAFWARIVLATTSRDTN